jgi:hypothetical protein
MKEHANLRESKEYRFCISFSHFGTYRTYACNAMLSHCLENASEKRVLENKKKALVKFG